MSSLDRSLFRAVQRADEADVEDLLDEGADCCGLVEGDSALAAAARLEKTDILRLFLERGDVSPEYLATALRDASRMGNVEGVKLLASRTQGSERYVRRAERLVRDRAAVATDSHLEATLAEVFASPAALRTRIEAGLSPKAVVQGRPLLMYADSECTEVLLELGAEPDAPTENGWGPLHRAADRGDVSTVSALLSAGADPNREDEAGRTPLHEAAAASSRAAELLRLVLAAGGDPTLRDDHGARPVDRATYGGPRALEVFAELGLYPEDRDPVSSS